MRSRERSGSTNPKPIRNDSGKGRITLTKEEQNGTIITVR